jgi:hypothetical protein
LLVVIVGLYEFTPARVLRNYAVRQDLESSAAVRLLDAALSSRQVVESSGRRDQRRRVVSLIESAALLIERELRVVRRTGASPSDSMLLEETWKIAQSVRSLQPMYLLKRETSELVVERLARAGIAIGGSDWESLNAATRRPSLWERIRALVWAWLPILFGYAAVGGVIWYSWTEKARQHSNFAGVGITPAIIISVCALLLAGWRWISEPPK